MGRDRLDYHFARLTGFERYDLRRLAMLLPMALVACDAFAPKPQKNIVVPDDSQPGGVTSDFIGAVPTTATASTAMTTPVGNEVFPVPSSTQTQTIGCSDVTATDEVCGADAPVEGQSCDPDSAQYACLSRIIEESLMPQQEPEPVMQMEPNPTEVATELPGVQGQQLLPDAGALTPTQALDAGLQDPDAAAGGSTLDASVPLDASTGAGFSHSDAATGSTSPADADVEQQPITADAGIAKPEQTSADAQASMPQQNEAAPLSQHRQCFQRWLCLDGLWVNLQESCTGPLLRTDLYSQLNPQIQDTDHAALTVGYCPDLKPAEGTECQQITAPCNYGVRPDGSASVQMQCMCGYWKEGQL